MDIFELNTNSSVVIEEFMGSKIYYIDNFFKKPDNIVNFLDKNPGKLHHPNNIPPHFKDRNSTDFLDVRHALHLSDVSKICKHLSDLCGQVPVYNTKMLITNITRFFKTSFNDYKNNYWWPHKDFGYTAIIYLNKGDTTNGTNLYKVESDDETLKYHYEHSHPWRSKKYFSVLKTIEPKYNRCILFDGGRFFHGMNIENERYFENEFRKNMAFFFRANGVLCPD